MTDKFVTVDVIYATPDQQTVIPVKLRPGATLYDAVVQSGMANRIAGLDIETAPLGVFGKVERSPKQRVLQGGERVEIYRPLIADPKESRKKRAAANAADAR